MTPNEVSWTVDRVDWLRIAASTPDATTEKLPGDTRLAQMASEQFGLEVTRHQIRHAIERFIKGGEEPTKKDALDALPPDVALVLRNNAALSAALEREKNKNTVLLEAIRSTVATLPPVTPLPVPKSGSDEPHVAMLDLSDVHIGEKVDPVLTGGISEYSDALFRERGERLRRGVHRIVGIHTKAYPVDRLFINILGDIVTGELVFPGQLAQIDMPLLRQILDGGHYFANMIRDFARLFREVHIRCVAGNHGREKGRHPRTNWDVLVYEMLKVMLADQPNVNIEVSESSWIAYRIPGHEKFRHIIVHGDAARGWGGIPFYGFEREGAGLQSMLGLPVEYLHAGHVHNKADWDVNRLTVLVNGSWVGGSDLSVNRMRRLGLPTQNFFFCHPKRGIAATYRIQLGEWAELEADEQGIYRAKAS